MSDNCALGADRLTQGETRWVVLSPRIMSGLFSIEALAEALLAGEQDVDQVVTRAAWTLGRPWRWLKPLALRYITAYEGQTRPRRHEVVQFLLRDKGFRHARSKYFHELSIEHLLTGPQRMLPVPRASTWTVPAIESAGDLATWLGLQTGELEWFADLKGLAYKSGRSQLAHYHYRVLAKGSGSFRLIESPKPRLKQLQRQILSLILNQIPHHNAVHGFVKGRSIKTFTALHVGQCVVLRMDLEDFFPSISGARIQTLFRTMGYPESVADRLGGICTNATPRGIWSACGEGVDLNSLWDTRSMYARPHLPQGAPVSPALANLCTYRVDCRLTGLAKSVGAKYTRYADDLAFSGGEDFGGCVERFSTHVAVILDEEGFRVNHRKTRIMRQGVRQHLTGLVINQRPSVRRTDVDRLKAILTNCVRLGPASQNRDAHPRFRSHLEGRVAFVDSINPAKGNRLRAILDRIAWG